jgi:hypothetical protein
MKGGAAFRSSRPKRRDRAPSAARGSRVLKWPQALACVFFPFVESQAEACGHFQSSRDPSTTPSKGSGLWLTGMTDIVSTFVQSGGSNGRVNI